MTVWITSWNKAIEVMNGKLGDGSKLLAARVGRAGL